MSPCNLCPRRCNVDRSKSLGWCKMDDRIHISSIVIHRGEEPPISGEKGIVNVFFPSCNMQCIYCQNWEISCRGTQGTVMSLDEVCTHIISLLPLSENNLGFVSPTHFVPQMVNIVEELRRRGHNPTIIYNTNGYDLPETIHTLEWIVDVWLPDFKYSDDNLAEELSQTPDYSRFAIASLKAMVHHVGATLHTDDRGIGRRGIIIRHLVLPGFVDNSIGVLKLIAEELSTNLSLSLMSQYYPPENLVPGAPNQSSQIANLNLRLRRSPAHERVPMKSEVSGSRIKPLHEPVLKKSGVSGRKSLLRPVNRQEYEKVVEAFHNLGFFNGWLQEYESNKNYRPDFSRKNPFDKPFT